MHALLRLTALSSLLLGQHAGRDAVLRLPAGFAGLSSLQVQALSVTGADELPSDIQRLAQLTALHASQPRSSSMPDGLGLLTDLRADLEPAPRCSACQRA